MNVCFAEFTFVNTLLTHPHANQVNYSGLNVPLTVYSTKMRNYVCKLQHPHDDL